MNKVHLILWGELMPKTLTGIAVSNSTILNILNEEGKKTATVEELYWKSNGVGKILQYLFACVKLIKLNLLCRSKYFYFMLHLSRSGLLRLLFIVPILRLIQPKAIYIAHLHRGDMLEFYNNSKSNRLLLLLTFSLIDKIIVLSPLFAKHVETMGFKKEIVCLRNTSPLERTKYTNKENYSNTFIAVTNYIETKGVMELVESFSDSDLNQLRLDIFGNVYESDTYNEVKKLKPSNVSVNGPLNREQLAGTIQEHDALILPSWNEGQPIVIIEAMSLGIPVIASEVGDVRNMVGEDYPFLFKPRDVQSMKDAIVRFSNLKDKNAIGISLLERYQLIFANKIFSENVKRIFS
jgi:glycosyltransferase involved in cell wall biosynthesis